MSSSAAGAAGPGATERQCVICTESCEEHENTFTLECGHQFHTGCIVSWFRTEGSSGSCPLCRQGGGTSLNSLGFQDALSRCTFLRRRARSRNAPHTLKRAVDGIRRAEEQVARATTEYSAFRKRPDVKLVLKRQRELRNKKWTKWRLMTKRKRELGVRSFPGMEIPLNLRSNRSSSRMLMMRYR